MEEDSPAQRIRTALYLMEMMIALRQQKIRRENPGLGEEQVAQRLDDWLREKQVPPGCRVEHVNGGTKGAA